MTLTFNVEELPMGIDLTLMPGKFTGGGRPILDWFLATERISLDRDYALQDRIRLVPTQPLPFGVRFRNYEDDGLKDRTDDQYDTPLTWCRAGDLAKVSDGDCSPWNKAAMAFVRALPPDILIVLWWH
jgi:hypothetical protein